MVVQEHGLGEEVLNIVSQYIGTNTPEIQVTYFALIVFLFWEVLAAWYSHSCIWYAIIHVSRFSCFCIPPSTSSLMWDVYVVVMQERCNRLKEKSLEKHDRSFRNFEGNGPEYKSFLGKSLSAALDSFDNLFCRRCLVLELKLILVLQSIYIGNFNN